MWDAIELWLRRAGGPLLIGAVMTGCAIARDRWWLPWRVVVLLGGVSAVACCCAGTWRLIRSREPAVTVLDRLEAAARGEGGAEEGSRVTEAGER
ncbi:hypothetical protein ACIOWI_31530 [Streptomyces sp. NPDC087659]|uniref:hypothetical protein n=1 Tax=unclassified Streptomyces TaxID=2593676 RepID=UPI0036AB60DC